MNRRIAGGGFSLPYSRLETAGLPGLRDVMEGRRMARMRREGAIHVRRGRIERPVGGLPHAIFDGKGGSQRRV